MPAFACRYAHIRIGIASRLGHRGLHEFSPDTCGKRAARYAFHRCVIVLANPHPDDQWVRKADEPRITVVLTGACLAGRKRAGISLTTSPALDNQL